MKELKSCKVYTANKKVTIVCSDSDERNEIRDCYAWKRYCDTHIDINADGREVEIKDDWYIANAKLIERYTGFFEIVPAERPDDENVIDYCDEEG